MKTITVQAVVDIPEFEAQGLAYDHAVFFSVIDVADYLSRVADAFDRAGAIRDIGGVLRVVTAELLEARLLHGEPVA